MFKDTQKREEVSRERGSEEFGGVVNVLRTHASSDGKLLSHGFCVEVLGQEGILSSEARRNGAWNLRGNELPAPDLWAREEA